jgi:hypothetical protein
VMRTSTTEVGVGNPRAKEESTSLGYKITCL